jgi:hypothetical protein
MPKLTFINFFFLKYFAIISNSYFFVLGNSDLKPEIEANQIVFPISIEVVNTNKYDGDARSFGYPCDEGLCTEVTYDFAVGTLSEDTISLAETLQKDKHLLKKPDVENMYDRVELSEDWKKELSTQWLKDKIREWLEKGLIDESETEEMWKNDIDNYHCWCQEWKDSYNTAYRELNEIDTTKEKMVLSFGSTNIYKKEGLFYSCSDYYNHGKTSLLDTDNIDLAIESVKSYNCNVKALNEKSKQLENNLELLKSLLKEA